MQASLNVHVRDWRANHWRRWKIECPRNLSPTEWSVGDADRFVVNVIRCVLTDEREIVGSGWNWWVADSKLHVRERGTLDAVAISAPAAFAYSCEADTNPIDIPLDHLERYPPLERRPAP